MRRDLAAAPRTSMLERAVQVLQAFRPDGRTLTLPELMRRTGLPKATVHRLADALVELQLLDRQQTGYRPGLGLLELGELVPAKRDVRTTALPFMQDLYQTTKATVHLGIRDGLDVVYVEKLHGHRGVKVPSRVGGRLPLSSTGVGKALLASADPKVQAEVLDRPLRRLSEHSITDPRELAAQLREIRRSGVAYDREEAVAGVGCISAPVLVHGEAVAALSLALPAERMDTAALAPAVRAVSLALGRALTRPSPVAGR